MMRHERKKIRWPIAVSLLTHSLFIGVALGSAAFGTRMVPQNAVLVTIVSSVAGDPGAKEHDHPSASSTADPPQSINDHKIQRPVLDTRPTVVQEEASHPTATSVTDETRLKPLEEEIAHEVRSQDEPVGQTDQAVTMDMQSVPQSAVGAYGHTPLPGGSSNDGAFGMGSPGSDAASGTSQDAMAEFISQVRQVIEQNKQYPSLARLQGVEGTTQLRFRILPTGEPTEIKVVQSSQSTVLDEAAVATVKRSGKFPRPPVTSNRGILIRLPLVFHLEGG